MARSEEEPEGHNAAFQAPAEQYSEAGGGQQPAPIRRDISAAGGAEPPGRRTQGRQPRQHLPRLPRCGRSKREGPGETSTGWAPV